MDSKASESSILFKFMSYVTFVSLFVSFFILLISSNLELVITCYFVSAVIVFEVGNSLFTYSTNSSDNNIKKYSGYAARRLFKAAVWIAFAGVMVFLNLALHNLMVGYKDLLSIVTIILKLLALLNLLYGGKYLLISLTSLSYIFKK